MDDQMQDTTSSDVSVLDDAVTAGTTPEGSAAASGSSPENGDQDADLLSVVRDVVKESRGQSDAASPAEGEEPGSEEASEGDAEEDKDYADVPFAAHPRFRGLLKEKRELKQKVAEYERQIEPLRQDAGRYQNVVSFLDQAGMTADEAADILQIGGLMKTNPVEAWARMKPTIQNLLIAAGEVLPEDLQGRVVNGEMSREAAIEVARARALASSVQRQQSFREQREQRTATETAARAVQQVAVDWETDRKRKDPNFAAKLPEIQREITYQRHLNGGKVPTSPEAAKQELDAAYKAVNDRFKPAAPAPTPKTAKRPVTGGQVAGNPQPAEMTTLDIIRAHRRA
ncbi:MAG: hypothetical protein ACOVN5_07160 [Aquidulcibacter sp.]